MGRIKTALIKRVAIKLFSMHKGIFSEKFDKNKEILDSIQDVGSKKLRNILAGYVTRLAMRQRKEEEMLIKDSERITKSSLEEKPVRANIKPALPKIEIKQ